MTGSSTLCYTAASPTRACPCLRDRDTHNELQLDNWREGRMPCVFYSASLKTSREVFNDNQRIEGRILCVFKVSFSTNRILCVFHSA